MSTPPSRDAGYFDRLYGADPDPWCFASSRYERDKYAATLRALPERHFENGLEIGCSIGVLTAALAKRCDRLLALDISAAPLVEARRRCVGFGNVDFVQCAVPGEWPGGAFDLVIISEVLYFMDLADIAALALRVRQSMRAGGSVLLVNWLGATDAPCSGDEAAEGFIAGTGLAVASAVRTAEYRLDLLRGAASG